MAIIESRIISKDKADFHVGQTTVDRILPQGEIGIAKIETPTIVRDHRLLVLPDGTGARKF